MALKQANNGQFQIPVAPSAGTAVAQSGSANTYGSYVAMTASTSEADYILGIRFEATTTQVPTYLSVTIGTGGSGSETTVGIVDCPVAFTTGAASTQIGGYVALPFPIPVANATRIAVKTASSAASAISWNISLTVMKQADIVDAAIAETSNVTQIDGNATSGNNATLNLKQINIVNSAGDAIVASSTGSNGQGINASGNGSGAGLKSLGGSTGHGASLSGGATSGDGINSTGNVLGHGLNLIGKGTSKHGLLATGGATSGNGINAAGGSTSGAGVYATSTSGDGVTLLSGGGSGSGMNITGNGTGSGFQTTGGAGGGYGAYFQGSGSVSVGMLCIGGPDGYGAAFEGGASGAGMLCLGGATGAGARFVGGATSGIGIIVTTTLGDGVSITPTAGHAVVATANGTSKHGVVATGGTAGTSDGIKAVAGTGGVPIRGDLTGNITGNLSGSAGSVTGAVGSVTAGVTVTTNNDKTGYTLTVTPPTASTIATTVWQDAIASDFTTAGSIGKSLFTSGNAPGATSGLALVGSNVGIATSVSGAVGSVTGAVGSVTGAVGSVTAAVTLSVGDSPVIATGTATAGAASTITLQTALGADSLVNGCKVKVTSGTGAKQERTITGYVDSTKVVTVDRSWTTNPDNTSVYAILYDDAPKTDSSLQVTAASVQGNVTGSVGSVTGTVGSVTGNVGGNVTGSVGSVVSGVTVTTNNDKTGYTLTVTPPTAITIATTVWQDTTANDFTSAGSIGKSLFTSGNVPGATSGLSIVGSNVGTATSVSGSVGSVTGNVGGNVTGSVGSVVAGVTVTTNNDKTGYSLTVTPPTAATIATTIWQDLLASSDFGTASSIGALLKADIDATISSRGTGTALTASAVENAVWDSLTSAHTTAGSFGTLVTTDLDATISSRSTYAGWDTSGTTTLLTRVTATRAGYLDNLSGGAVVLAGSAPGWYTSPVDVSANVTAIKAKTDNLPTSPAAVGSAMTLDLTEVVPTTNTANTVGDCLNAARAQGFGVWRIMGTTLSLYAPDGSTVVRSFTLDSTTAPTQRL